MSDISLMTPGDNGIHVYVSEDVGAGSIEKAQKLLAGIPGAANKALNRSIMRATTSAEAYAARVLREKYVIKAGDSKAYTHAKRHYIATGNGTGVFIEFRGCHIPLIKFDTKVGSNGRVTARVKRESSRKILDHAFAGKTGLHDGIYERETSERLPIRQFMGPSTPQMMSYNDDIQEKIGEKFNEVYEERLDHEILAILNGWVK